jgi:peptidoglycan/LPS O-acetylase OafA/YrhL
METVGESHGGGRRLVVVDALRGLAALLVVLLHVPHLLDQPQRRSGLLFLPMDLGFRGVPMFLVLSGFCIHLGAARRAAAGRGLACDWAAFWRRRFVRLYPPYLAAIAFSLLLMRAPFGGLGFAWYPGGRLGLTRDVLAHLLLVHNVFPQYLCGLNNPPFWSLALEEQLYALYFVLLLLRRRLPGWFLLLAGGALVLLWCASVVGLLAPAWQASPWSLNCPLTWWFAWLLGAAAAEAHTGAARLPRWCSSRAVAALCALASLLMLPRVLQLCQAGPFLAARLGPDAWTTRLLGDFPTCLRLGDMAAAAACFVLLNRWARAEARGRRWGRLAGAFAWLGVISYSLYLTHYPVSAWWTGPCGPTGPSGRCSTRSLAPCCATPSPSPSVSASPWCFTAWSSGTSSTALLVGARPRRRAPGGVRPDPTPRRPQSER